MKIFAEVLIFVIIFSLMCLFIVGSMKNKSKIELLEKQLKAVPTWCKDLKEYPKIRSYRDEYRY